MGGCASFPAKLRKEDDLAPEPAKEEVVKAEGAEAKTEVEKKVAEEEGDKKEVIEDTKGPSLGNLLDEDEKKHNESVPKKEGSVTETKVVEAEEKKTEEKKEDVAVGEVKKDAETK